MADKDPKEPTNWQWDTPNDPNSKFTPGAENSHIPADSSTAGQPLPQAQFPQNTGSYHPPTAGQNIPNGTGFNTPQPAIPSPNGPTPMAPNSPAGAPRYGQYGTPGANPRPFKQQVGIIPLRPLDISDLFTGSFGALRTNPKTMFGFSVIISLILGLITGVIAYFTIGESLQAITDPSFEPQTTEEVNSAIRDLASSLSGLIITSSLTSLFGTIATQVIVGFLTVAVSQATIGRKPTIGETWRSVSPRILPLLGLVFLQILIQLVVMTLIALVFGGIFVGIFAANDWQTPGPGTIIAMVFLGIFGFLALVLVLLWITTMMIYAPVCCVLEEVGPIAAIKRSFKLVKGSFWSTLGRYLLITLLVQFITGIAAQIGGLASGILAVAGLFRLSMAISQLFTFTLIGFFLPIMASWITLMYVDRRIRSEGLADSLKEASESN